MADVLAEIGGVRLTVRMAGMIVTLLVLILFMLLRMAMNKKAAEGTRTLMKWLDGIGFGLLPAAAVWKIFDAADAGAGRALIEPLPQIPWLTENGRFLPCSIEAATALLCFAGLCIWLMVRKDELAGKDDVLIISLCLWSGIRVVTESFREAPDNILRYVYCAVILICLAIWTARQQKQPDAKRRAAGSWLAAILCTAMIVLTASGTLTVGSAIGDLAVITGCAVLTVLLALLCGNDSRAVISG